MTSDFVVLAKKISDCVVPRTLEQQKAADELERDFHELHGLGRYTFQELAVRAKAQEDA
jgi:hypothetical protein